jgi:LacI family transcriptional regulator
MRKVLRVILLIESSRASGRSLLRGIASYARHHRRWVFFWEPAGLEKAWPRLKTLEADGVILRDVEGVNEVLAYGLPAVVVGHSRKEVLGVANLVSDSVEVGRLAAEHLLERGLEHFAYCGFEQLPWSQERAISFCARLDQAGRPAHLYPSPGRRAWRDELRFMAGWLRSLPKPLGLMACNDDRAQ